MKYRISTGSSFVLDFVVDEELIGMCYHSGDCYDDVRRALELPEIKAQTDAIPDDELDKWWGEFFCDDTPEEHACVTREGKLVWALFDAAANAVDGEKEEVKDE